MEFVGKLPAAWVESNEQPPCGFSHAVEADHQGEQEKEHRQRGHAIGPGGEPEQARPCIGERAGRGLTHVTDG